MKRVATIAVCAALLGALGASAVVEVRSQSTASEVMRSKRGTPLASMVKPGQARVIIEKDQTPPLFVQPPPGLGQLEWLTQVSETVLVIEVGRAVPELTPDHDWIKSTVHASIVDVLKSTQTFPGQAIRFTQDGGQMEIAGTTVSAVLPWAEPFEAGRRYVVFGLPTEDADVFVVDAASGYRITEAGKLSPLAKGGKFISERDVPVATAMQRIRAAADKKGQTR